MYKTSDFEGQLLADTDEGEQFWLNIDELLATPKERFSSVHYSLSPLFHEYGKYSEVIILWSGDESTWEVYYKQYCEAVVFGACNNIFTILYC